MAIPLHLWLTDQRGAAIRGSSQVKGREGSIEILSFSHGMRIPTDGNTGKLTGGRCHEPMIIEKEIDRSSPILYMTIARGLTLLRVEIKWYRISESGEKEEYFNMLMTNVKVVSAGPRVQNIKDEAATTLNHLETVELRYEQISWKYLDGNLIFSEAWNMY